MEVKETKEMIIGLGEVAGVVAKIAKDGKLGLDDVQVLMKADFAKIAVAVEGADQIKAEIKDLSLEEAKELLTLLVDQVTLVKAA